MTAPTQTMADQIDPVPARVSKFEVVAIPSSLVVLVLSRIGIPDRLGLSPDEVAELAGWILFAASSIRAALPILWPKLLAGVAALSRALRGGDPGKIHVPALFAVAGLALAAVLALVLAFGSVIRCAAEPAAASVCAPFSGRRPDAA